MTHVTVNRTISRLQKTGLVTSQPYRAIFLTDTGRNLAAACKSRHETVVAFLRSLGIPERVAERDAEGMSTMSVPTPSPPLEPFFKRAEAFRMILPSIILFFWPLRPLRSLR